MVTQIFFIGKLLVNRILLSSMAMFDDVPIKIQIEIECVESWLHLL